MTRRTLAVALAAALIAPAAAQAQPADMHASTAQAIAAERAQSQHAQDLRSPDARDAARPAVAPRPIGQDLRSPDVRDLATRQTPPAGQPTWPVDPQPIVAPASQTVSHDDGSPVPVVPIVAAALLVLLAAQIARYTARRTGRGTRVAV